MSLRAQRGNLVAIPVGNAMRLSIAMRLPRRPGTFALAASRNDMVFIF